MTQQQEQQKQPYLRFLAKMLLVPDRKDRCYPLLRGKIHLLLTYLSPLWFALLLSQNARPRAFGSALVASCSFFLNFASSALLHNRQWTQRQMLILSKLDYVGIFVMISGSCAPIPMLWSGRLLVAGLLTQWGSTLVGVWMVVFGGMHHFRGPRAFVFVFVGLLNVVFVKYVIQHLLPIEVFSLFAMAGSYILGATVYASHWPNPWPKVFGYHEIFHCCCLLSMVFTLIVDISVLRRL